MAESPNPPSPPSPPGTVWFEFRPKHRGTDTRQVDGRSRTLVVIDITHVSG